MTNLQNIVTHELGHGVGLDGVYISPGSVGETVKSWPELYPTDLIPFIRLAEEKGAHRRGSPDLYAESCVEPKIYAASVSKRLKETKEYEYSALYAADIVVNYARRMRGSKVELKYGIVVYKEVTHEDRDKVLHTFKETILKNAQHALSKEKLVIELFDLESIRQDLLHNKDKDPYANHLYITLREMKLL